LQRREARDAGSGTQGRNGITPGSKRAGSSKRVNASLQTVTEHAKRLHGLPQYAKKELHSAVVKLRLFDGNATHSRSHVFPDQSYVQILVSFDQNLLRMTFVRLSYPISLKPSGLTSLILHNLNATLF
jgi:hypothetical protein